MKISDWLLDSDPSIQWQVLQDLLCQPNDVVAATRSRVASEGWGAKLLQLQGSDGNWDGAPFIPNAWTCTHETLMLLRRFGADPNNPRVRAAIELVKANVNWGQEFKFSPFFEGEIEPCINGRVLALGSYFGCGSRNLVDRLLGEQLPDGGWNCEAPPSKCASFHSTICVLEGLLEYETAYGSDKDILSARLRGQEYLLARGMFRSRTTQEVINPTWLQFSFPTRWHYDLLWGLDYLRRAKVAHEMRLNDAISVLRGKQDSNGKWPLENTHPGKVFFEIDQGEGSPSRWNTLRALQALKWFER